MPDEAFRIFGGAALAASVGIFALVLTGDRDPAILSFLFVLLGCGAYQLWRWQTRGQ